MRRGPKWRQMDHDRAYWRFFPPYHSRIRDPITVVIQRERPTVILWDLAKGCILWLPTKDHMSLEHYQRGG